MTTQRINAALDSATAIELLLSAAEATRARLAVRMGETPAMETWDDQNWVTWLAAVDRLTPQDG